MANKQWNYVVALYSPEEMEKTPKDREVSYVYVKATTAKRAISIAEKQAADKAGWSRKQYEIIEAYIDRSEESRAPEFSWNADEED